MEFHLNYSPAPSLAKIAHADKVLLIGSCFAESIGGKLKENKFTTLVNPNGILFNPFSIATAISSYIKNESNPKPGINNNLYFSFNHHGSFSSASEEELTNKINSATKEAHLFLKEAKFLIITFGSAFAYRHVATNQIVANCHKLPQKDFKKELLSADVIVLEYNSLIKSLKEFNPKLNIIFTVSPVKYLRDGVIENNLSKAILIQSVHQLLTPNSEFPTTNYSTYFPAYELVNDDLRDYRFYKEDMAHPNEQAINYVWEKFSDTYFNEETNKLVERITEITQASLHRPIKPNASEYLKFKKVYYDKCLELEKKHAFLDFSSEKLIYS